METRADLQRYYNLNVDKMGDEYSVAHAAACLSCLPAGSRLMAQYNPQMEYTIGEIYLHTLLSAMCKEPIPFPWERDENNAFSVKSIPIEQFDAWLNQDWKEIDGS